VAIRVQSTAADTEWITVTVEQADGESAVVCVNRAALQGIVQQDPRPPEIILDALCERAVKRMPLPNSNDGVRLITSYNLSLVWPK
jgi:hypothetical protein